MGYYRPGCIGFWWLAGQPTIKHSWRRQVVDSRFPFYPQPFPNILSSPTFTVILLLVLVRILSVFLSVLLAFLIPVLGVLVGILVGTLVASCSIIGILVNL